jgi:hypothetical protein
MIDGRSWGPGTWHLLIAQRADLRQAAPEAMLSARLSERSVVVRPGKALSYTAVVNARSALRLSGHVTRHDGATPGFEIEASVDYAGAALRSAPTVVAQVDTPRGLRLQVPLTASEPGRFFGRFEAVQPGIYATRLRAQGRSPGARPFIRELTLTPALAKNRGCVAPCDAGAERVQQPGEKRDGVDAWRVCQAELRRLLDCFKRRRGC